MTTERYGKVIKGLGGLYETRVIVDGIAEICTCRAKGNLKRDEEKLLIGDNVRISVDEDTAGGVVISEILPRKNSLIRPPMANLDYIFIAFAAAKPAPVRPAAGCRSTAPAARLRSFAEKAGKETAESPQSVRRKR